MPATPRYALGLDLGTGSARALLVDVANGRPAGQAVAPFKRGRGGVLTDPSNPHVARQDPRDWLTALTRAVRAALSAAAGRRGFRPERIVGIGVDTTASTPTPVDAQCRPLTRSQSLAQDLAAHAWLWKDHSAHAEAEQITELARQIRPQFLAHTGGVYSSEWFWSKILHCCRVAPKVFAAADSWLEQCDFITAALIGAQSPADVPRSICAAGHKGMFHPSYGLPDAAFLGQLEPGLADLRERLYTHAFAATEPAGPLCASWARKLGLPAGITVAVGAIDAHLGAVGAGIAPGTLVKIIGTSTCDMLVLPPDGPAPDIAGLAGIVEGSILPGHFGVEAGQAAVGDLFGWYADTFAAGDHAGLTRAATRLAPGASGLLALDWNNGNRSVLADQRLSGLLVGQTLGTTPAEIYRALIEATAFGARMILERMEQLGTRIKRVVATGGIAEKSPLLLQIYADVLNRPIATTVSDQTCALGAAICGAVAAGKAQGGHASVGAAQRAMCALAPKRWQPQKKAVLRYNELFALYARLHDAFGKPGSTAALGDVMKTLLQLRERVSL